ncbi:MAG: tRNA lysidine(34) synthetase TilS [Synergistota bacterium]|nr:tRNA lysidine(34) synthetase TilS [Synergistota bacterium]
MGIEPEKRFFDNATADICKRFRNAGLRQGWWECDAGVLAAVSGGSDSMAMLWLLRYVWGGKLAVAHLNHGMREATSFRDAGFVRKIAGEWGLDFVSKTISIGDLRQKGETLEEAGRRERYGFLREAARETGTRFIATGHTSDDVVETVLFNCLRGSGIRGLRGIAETNGVITRPVIECAREDLQHLLGNAGVSWMTDETNEDTSYARNRIRHEVIPFLETNGPPGLKQRIRNLAAEAAALECEREKKFGNICLWCRTRFPLAIRAWSISRLRDLDQGYLAEIFRYEARELGLQNLSRRRTSELLRLVSGQSGGWRFQWEKSLEVCGGGGLAALVDTGASFGDGSNLEIDISPEQGHFEWNGWRFLWFPAGESRDVLAGDWTMTFPPCPRNGIRCCSLAESRIFARHPRIPFWARENWPVVMTGNMAWSPLAGHRTTGARDGNNDMLRLTAVPPKSPVSLEE